MQPAPFAIQAYQHRARPISAQQVVNLYAEKAPRDEKTPVVLLGTPGLALFSVASAGPLRGEHVMNEVLFVVSGTEVYRVDANGVASLLGTIAGEGPAKMADNGTQLAIVSGEKGYIYDGMSLVQITDPDFPGAVDVAYLDGYFIFIQPRTGEFFISGQYNGTTFDALDFATAEAAPDNLVAVVVDHQVAWLFGRGTIEIWYNSGDPDFPLERVSGAVIERGVVAVESIARLDNSVFWLGRGPASEGGYVVYRNNGFQPIRVSTHAVESKIESYDNVEEAVAFAYTQEGHSFYCLSFRRNATWVFDATTGLWHERDSRTAENASLGQWRPLRHAFVYGKHIVSCCDTGALFDMDPTYGDDNGTTIQRLFTFAPAHSNRDLVTVNRFELDIGPGQGLVSGQGSDPQAMLQWSDDGGHTWSKERWRGFGKMGKFKKRAFWTRLGSFRERVFRVTVSDPVPVTIRGGYMDGQAVSG